MYLGSIVEIGETERLFSAPKHPYTQALLAAAPDMDARRRSRVAAARGELPSPLALPTGCPFHPRCPHVFDRCRVEQPLLTEHPGGDLAACHLADPAPPQTGEAVGNARAFVGAAAGRGGIQS